MKTPEKDLFTDHDFSQLEKTGLKLKSETVSYVKQSVEIDGETFELGDLLDTLEQLNPPCNIILDNCVMEDVFLKYVVLKDPGSQRWMTPARIGPNFHKFEKMVLELTNQKE